MKSNEPLEPAGSDRPSDRPHSLYKARDIWNACRQIYGEYTGITRLFTVLLLCAVTLSILKPFACRAWMPCLPPAWAESLSSDGMLTLLTLLVAFCIAIHIKLRIENGLVDGAEHYSIGRALAYGYFSNFLLVALLLVRAENEKNKAAGAPRARLKVVFPARARDVAEFRRSIEEDIRVQAVTRDLAGVTGAAAKMLQRKVLVIYRDDPGNRPAGAGDSLPEGAFFVDFPTTLYTLQDYFATWNVWLRDNDKKPMDDDELERLQQKHIDDFFAHLKDLSMHAFGLEAARRLGLSMDREELASLFADYFERVESGPLIAALQRGAAPAGPRPPAPP